MRHDYTATSIPADSATTTHIGFIQAHNYGGSITAEDVVVEQTGASDADWNVEVDHAQVFSNPQTVAAADTPEEFVPDQNREATGSWVKLEFVVTTASGTTTSTLNVSVSVDDGRGE